MNFDNLQMQGFGMQQPSFFMADSSQMQGQMGQGQMGGDEWGQMQMQDQMQMQMFWMPMQGQGQSDPDQMQGMQCQGNQMGNQQWGMMGNNQIGQQGMQQAMQSGMHQSLALPETKPKLGIKIVTMPWPSSNLAEVSKPEVADKPPEVRKLAETTAGSPLQLQTSPATPTTASSSPMAPSPVMPDSKPKRGFLNAKIPKAGQAVVKPVKDEAAPPKEEPKSEETKDEGKAEDKSRLTNKSLPRWSLPKILGSQSPNFVSCIQALNLEPSTLRYKPQHLPNKPTRHKDQPIARPPKQAAATMPTSQSQPTAAPQMQAQTMQSQQLRMMPMQGQQMVTMPMQQMPMQGQQMGMPFMQQASPGMLPMMSMQMMGSHMMPMHMGNQMYQMETGRWTQGPAPQQEAVPVPKKRLVIKNATILKPAARTVADASHGFGDADDVRASPCESSAPRMASDDALVRESQMMQPFSRIRQASPSQGATNSQMRDATNKQVFERPLMLQVWRECRMDINEKSRSLGMSTQLVDKGRDAKKAPDRSQSTMGEKSSGPSLKPGKDAWVNQSAKPPVSRGQELEGTVLALLNKICPDNFEAIVRQLSEVELYTVTELELVITIILQKALNEPHYCKTYADMVFILMTTYPEFPAERDGEKPRNFRSVLLNACQKEFESSPTTLTLSERELQKLNGPEEIALERRRRKDRLLANMKFIGALFLRELLAVKVITSIIEALIGVSQDALPEEHEIESAAELLTSVGHTLDQCWDGRRLMSQCVARLTDLVNQQNGEKSFYPARIRFLVQGLRELRQNGWMRRLHRAEAKTMDEVRREARNQMWKDPMGIQPEQSMAGIKPRHLKDLQQKAEKMATISATCGPPAWSEHYVKRCMNYFAEHKDEATLVREWTEPSPTPKDQRRGVEWLLNVAQQNPMRGDAIAETISILVRRKVLTWDMLGAGMKPFLQTMEELKLDSPHMEAFAHNLVARILVLEPFDPVLLKVLPWMGTGDCKLTNGLLMGALRRVKTTMGTEAVSRLVQGNKQLSDALARASGCQAAGLSAHLKHEGVLQKA